MDWDVFKGLMSWIIYPIMLIVGFLFKHIFQQQTVKIEHLEQEVMGMKIGLAVANSQITDIKKDIEDLTIVIRNAEKAIIAGMNSLRKDMARARG